MVPTVPSTRNAGDVIVGAVPPPAELGAPKVGPEGPLRRLNGI